eukprot:11764461-Alexandrium_andersonii.AAC.1
MSDNCTSAGAVRGCGRPSDTPSASLLGSAPPGPVLRAARLFGATLSGAGPVDPRVPLSGALSGARARALGRRS